MDTSKLYIKMCRKATEIQEQFKEINAGDIIRLNRDLDYHFKTGDILHSGDWINNEEDGEYYRIYDGYDGFQSFSRDNFTIIPRQDQLQKILDNEYSTYELFEMFDHEFLEQYDVGGAVRYPKWVHGGWSMEQFWLAYVMKEKYNKTWNGEDWVV